VTGAELERVAMQEVLQQLAALTQAALP